MLKFKELFCLESFREFASYEKEARGSVIFVSGLVGLGKVFFGNICLFKLLLDVLLSNVFKMDGDDDVGEEGI